MIAFKLCYKEIKNNKKYWSFFTANLCIGLLGFSFIYLFRANVNKSLELRSKTLLSADLAISGRRSLTAEEQTSVDKTLEGSAIERTKIQELYSMGTSSKKSRLVFIKAIQGKYPLLGEITLEKIGSLTPEIISSLQTKPYLIISPEVAYQFQIAKGDHLKLGEQNFEVLDILKSDSTSSLRGINLAPKVYIGDAFLNKTKLISFGTLSFHTQYFNFKQNIDVNKLKEELTLKVTDPAISVQTPDNSSEQLGRVVGYITNYLGLIGVVALLLSCIGGSYLFQSYLLDRIQQIGIMRSVGVAKNQIILSFIGIITLLGGLATLISVLVASWTLPIVLSYFTEWVNIDIQTGLDLQIILVTVSIGVLVNLMICIPILIRVFRTNISMLLANELKTGLKLIDILAYIPALIFLWGISVWQANSFIVGSLFFISIFIVFLFVLGVLPFILKFFSATLQTRPLSWPISLSFGYGARIVTRNYTTTILSILCLSVGSCLINVIGQLDHSLKKELGGDTSKKPSLFLFDIQQEQISDFEKFAAKNDIPLLPPSPMIRARLLKKNGEAVKRMIEEDEFQTNESDRRRRFNNRGVNLTYSEGANDSETIVEGVEFKKNQSEDDLPQISLEKRYADRLEVGLGDTLTYEILGIELQGKVVNIRTVKWTSFLPNFFIKFEPGYLEDAPKTYLSAVQNVSFKRQLEIQDLIVEKFSNISIVNVTELIGKMIELFSIMAIAVGLMSLCCIGVGVFVLFSILQSQMYKKHNEFALQKINGMGKNQIFASLMWEYMLLVLTSILFGSLFGVGVSRVVSLLFLDGNFSLDFGFIFNFSVGLLIISFVVVYATFKLLYRKKINQLLD